MFRRTTKKEEILASAYAEAERLGVEEFLVIVKRGGRLVTVASPEEIREDDQFVGILTDAKGGAIE